MVRIDDVILHVNDTVLAVDVSTGEPRSYLEATTAPDSAKWEEAMSSEYQALLENGTWELVPLPVGRKAVKGRWVYKIKHKMDGSVERYKARFVAQGFTQISGIDFDETFSPTVKITF